MYIFHWYERFFSDALRRCLTLPRHCSRAISANGGWSTQIGSYTSEPNNYYYGQQERATQPSLMLSGDRLYVDSHAGTLIQLESVTGQIEWGLNYLSERQQGQVHPHGQGLQHTNQQGRCESAGQRADAADHEGAWRAENSGKLVLDPASFHPLVPLICAAVSPAATAV